MLLCLKPINAIHQQITVAVTADPEAKLMKMRKGTVASKEVELHSLFQFEFFNHTTFQAVVDECKAISMLYTDETLYGTVGSISTNAFNIAMFLGGSEAIVKSFCMQSSETLC